MKADMQSEVKRAHGTGEVIREGTEEMRGTKTRRGGRKGTDL